MKRRDGISACGRSVLESYELVILAAHVADVDDEIVSCHGLFRPLVCSKLAGVAVDQLSISRQLYLDEDA